VALRNDLRAAGVELRLTKKQEADLAAFERAQRKRHRNELLRSAGLDPRPPRCQGKAVKPIREIELRLARAVRDEDYERAAELRDEIKRQKGVVRVT
jgi:protein-arginine kinase activator protein McsA